MRRRHLLASPALLLGGGAASQSWPDRPVRLIVPFGGGGPADAVARMAMEGASQALGQRITIENRPGAGAVVGTEAVFRAPADGATFLLATVSHVVSAGIIARLPYDPDKDFRGVALTGTVPLVVVVHPDNPARTFPELLARMREPGEHDYGTSGVGSAQHLGGALLGAMAGLRLNQVPYRGNPSALTDLAGGRLTFVMESTATTVPLVRAGTLKALAVTGPARSALLPDVPTVAESGVPGFEAYTWNAILARAGTPESAIRGMNAAVNAGLKSPTTGDRLRNAGIEVTDSMTPDMVDAFVAEQGAKWRPLLTAAGVRPE
ncbi:Bug family tripartite tricarboxylate transporter substrate binding protein [Roseococcus sp. YIM B11640]|uniref:Bug family tripartite tricarboxylate transporter substrate binding protein n=1 Tax=Roseococcus sp. YIM B11640 TaxID=3133973 RepID=UPI003C7DDAA6